MTASKMAKEYSHTRSHFDWTDMIDRTAFRSKYMEDCNEVNKSIAITDVYLAEYKEHRFDISDNLARIYGNMNCFWGDQEELLRNEEVDAEHREAHKSTHIMGIIQASRKISECATKVQRKIVEIVAILKEDQDVQHS